MKLVNRLEWFILDFIETWAVVGLPFNSEVIDLIHFENDTAMVISLRFGKCFMVSILLFRARIVQTLRFGDKTKSSSL